MRKVTLIWTEERSIEIKANSIEEAREKWNNGELDFDSPLIDVDDCNLTEVYFSDFC